MNDKYFIDTNIWVYANDHSDSLKQQRAKEIIIQGLYDDNIVISTQVISEFFVTVTKKISKKLSIEKAKKEILLLKNIEIAEIDYQSILQAIEMMHRHQLSYWDSLIIVAAQNSRCSVIYSEDMNPGKIMDGLRIQNPF